MWIKFFFLSLISIVNSQVCTVNIDCDSSCYQKYGNQSDEKLLRLFQESIYPYNNIGLDWGFKINQIRIHQNIYLGHGDGGVTLQRYRTFIMLNYAHNVSCINLLFTDNNDNSLLGIAYVDGKCLSTNVGVVKINTEEHNIGLIMAHEIGHLMGLHHDCELKSSDTNKLCSVLKGTDCVPYEHPYIMYPRIVECSKNINKLSPCSIYTLLHPDYDIPCLQDGTVTPVISYDANCHFIKKTTKRILTIIAIVGGMIIGCAMCIYYINYAYKKYHNMV